MKHRVSALAACATLAFGSGALAEETPPVKVWSLSGNIGVVSDYQYRGYSLSGSDPAVQGGLTLDGPHGFYFGVWGSAIEEYGIDGDGDGALIEIDLSVGRAFTVAGWDWDVALLHYGYPDASNVDYFEIPISASRTHGAFTGTLGFEYAPTQDNLGGEDNKYFYIGGEYAPEHWPISLNAQVGHEDGAFADGKLDWQLGVAKPIGPVSISVQYSDSDGPGAESSVVWGLTLDF